MGRGAAHLIALIERVVRYALGLLLIAMVLLNAAAASARYLFGDGLVGSDELMVFALVWVVFLGAALLEREGRHLNFDLLLKLLPQSGRHVLRAGIGLVSALVLAVVAWQSLAVVERLGALGQVSMAGGVPMAVPHAALLAGLGLAALASLATAVRSMIAACTSDRAGERVEDGAR
jgi:TRAP-type C4-dicarboxylate transport system permease small subunit